MDLVIVRILIFVFRDRRLGDGSHDAARYYRKIIRKRYDGRRQCSGCGEQCAC